MYPQNFDAPAAADAHPHPIRNRATTNGSAQVVPSSLGNSKALTVEQAISKSKGGRLLLSDKSGSSASASASARANSKGVNQAVANAAAQASSSGGGNSKAVANAQAVSKSSGRP
ncbi:hypothetical protein HaLaN_31158 [Haematococcus lacustris]|uniref:Uncharacterized protein n=1 Tax=Haematococcus lacustris TaxID=44745 RepID=A0A6A0AHB1_HAELA|nr:hypothetical protein HaLaN_31158 [Haematococcus lacustris]